MTREIEHGVKKAMRRHPDLDLPSVWPTADGGVVTLHGSVHTLAERQRAERAAATTEGVTEVRNHILVLPARD